MTIHYFLIVEIYCSTLMKMYYSQLMETYCPYCEKMYNEVNCTFLDWTWSRLSAAAEDLNGDIFWRKFMHVYIVCVHV